MKTNILSLLFLSVVILTACKKETIVQQTQTDQIARELKRLLDTASTIKRVYWIDSNNPLPPSPIPFDLGTNWVISNGFISIDGYYTTAKSLLFLKYYTIGTVRLEDNSSVKALLLYFKD